MYPQITLAMALGTIALSAAAPTATADNGACPKSPSNYVAWATSAVPYEADDLSDLDSDGLVCAKPLRGQTFTDGGVTYQVYVFIDDLRR